MTRNPDCGDCTTELRTLREDVSQSIECHEQLGLVRAAERNPELQGIGSWAKLLGRREILDYKPLAVGLSSSSFGVA